MNVGAKAYQVAILRYRHDAGSGERLNIGVLMWADERILLFKVNPRCDRLQHAFPALSTARYEEIKADLEHRLPFEERHFKTPSSGIHYWMQRLAQPDAGVLQWSEVYAGVCDNPVSRFLELYTEFITRWELPHN